jgi:ankyrin repeat protein
MTQLLLSLHGGSIDMEQVDEDKKLTPLLLAASKHESGITSLLLEHANRPNILARDPNGWTVLHHALFRPGGENMIGPLIRAGADVNAITTDDHKMSPLHFAARENNVAAAETLLNNGAAIDTPDNASKTPLWLAVDGKKYEMCSLLLQRRAVFDRPKMAAAYSKIEDIFREMKFETPSEPSSPLSSSISTQSLPRRASIEPRSSWVSRSSLKLPKLFGSWKKSIGEAG